MALTMNGLSEPCVLSWVISCELDRPWEGGMMTVGQALMKFRMEKLTRSLPMTMTYREARAWHLPFLEGAMIFGIRQIHECMYCGNEVPVERKQCKTCAGPRSE